MRSAQESANLRVYSKEHDVCAAETFRTAACVTFPGNDFLRLVEAHNGHPTTSRSMEALLVDRRNPSAPKVVTRNAAFLYGHRPKHPEIWFLSPYEFFRSWDVVLATYPLSLDSHEDNDCHAQLTKTGVAKLKRHCAGERVYFTPGKDYVVKSSGGADWLPLADDPQTTLVRHVGFFS